MIWATGVLVPVAPLFLDKEVGAMWCVGRKATGVMACRGLAI